MTPPAIPQTTQQSLPLRDIHLPDPTSWWPPSPWLWLVVAGLALLLFALFRWAFPWLLQRYRQRAINYRPAARAELAAIEQRWRDGEIDRAQLAAELNQLLRRTVASEEPQSAIGDTGEAWLALLIQHFQLEQKPSESCAHALTRAAYQADPEFDADSVLNDIKQWLSGRYKAPQGGRHARV